jgi:hypothetical protein
LKKGIDYISKMSYRLVVILGLMVGFVALTLTTPLVPQVQIISSQSGDQDEQSDLPEMAVSAFDAITSTVHFNLDHGFHLDYILPDLEDDGVESGSTDQVTLPGTKALRILFRRIISPNAP